MLHIFNARNAKASARSLERFMDRLGFDLKHGRALDALSVMAGAGNWAALANGTLSEAAMDAQLLGVELKHIEGNRDTDYGVECALIAHTGFELRYSADEHEDVTYVRVCDPLGREVAYWSDDEWKEDPRLVMGAILGALTRGKAAVIENGRHVAASPKAEEQLPTILDIPLNKISTVIIDHQPHFLRYLEPEGAEVLDSLEPKTFDNASDKAHLNKSEEFSQEFGWKTVFELGYEDGSGFIAERELDVDLMLSLKWDFEQKLFVDPEGSTYRFMVATPFGA
jgi:hypothetical protein